MPELVDLRSDTLTRPSEAMRRAMTLAEVGDDVYGEDPTVNELERRTAEIMGHEAGLFCPTGSMSNLLAVWSLVPIGKEILCDAGAHIVRAEMGAHAALHGITTRTWTTQHGRLVANKAAGLMSIGTGPFLVETAAIEVENTHNFGGGTIQPIDEIKRLRELTSAVGVTMHLDGARIWNAHVATGVGLADYGSQFDTVSVCLSKGLGAPIGSVLVSSAERIEQARVQRKRLGGGMRQVGILAAAGLYALENNIERLADDHANAKVLAETISDRAPGLVSTPESNILIIETAHRLAAEVAARAKEQGIVISTLGPHTLRAVTHLDVDRAGCVRAGEVLGSLLA